jgi:endonuclease YncB( thermonuclease family)
MLAVLLCWPALPWSTLQEGPPERVAPAAEAAAMPGDVVEVDVVEVIDGDTLTVRLDGEVVSLRLLSVDTEEKIRGAASGSASKPETVFGEETKLWAKELFAGLGAPPRVGLAFPEGRRADVYGRLLTHVILPDGRDYNLLLVELGKSPYFDKYGYSRRMHAEFVAAEARARAAELGIWNPATNRARTSGAPSAVRPYAELLPWWEARAQAIEAFRGRAEGEPGRWILAEDSAALQLAFETARSDPAARVGVLAEIERLFEESDVSLTVLLHPGDAQHALRAELPAALRAELEPVLRATTGEFRQNYLVVTGRMERNARGFALRGAGRVDWQVCAPPYPPR